MKNVQWQYLGYELWGNDKFLEVVENIMPQMKGLKNKIEG